MMDWLKYKNNIICLDEGSKRHIDEVGLGEIENVRLK